MQQLIDRALAEIYEATVARRRHLHRHPELSFHETKTAAYIAEALRAVGLDVREGVGGNGVVADLRGSSDGPTVALRADFDALPIQDEKGTDYASTVPGVMHACGHDAHTSALLSLAEAFGRHRERLRGHIRFIFQHAEEITPGGAASMIADGALDGADVVYGIHLWTPFEVGTAYSREGAMWACADEFQIEVVGRGGHAGQPHETVDSIYAASQLVVQLQSVVSRSVPPSEPCVVSVGSIQGGTSFNVIAERVRLSGTVRCFDEGVRSLVEKRMGEIVAGVCAANGAEGRFRYNRGYPPVVNDEGETARFFRTAPSVFGESKVGRNPLMMPGEDFAYYLQKIPGVFMLVGAGNREAGIVYPHHHPKFDIDERAMLDAARLFAAMTLDYLGQSGK